MFKKIFRKSIESDGGTGSPADSPVKDDAGPSPNPAPQLAGIGIVFQLAPDGGLYIKSMSEGGAAHHSGILEQGDCLMLVDGVKVFGKPSDYVSSKIMGPVGTPVATKFRRNVIDPQTGASSFKFVAPVLTRGQTAELPQPAGVGIIFKVGADKCMYVKSMSPDGAAKLSNQICVEDCLTHVDGRNVAGKHVVTVTPLLTGTFGSTVVLGLKRKGESGTRTVTLQRGKRATFRDTDTGPKVQQGVTTKAISVIVPDGACAGDIIAAQDDKGNIVKVTVPQGAVKGTMLRVPVGLIIKSSAGQVMSNPEDLERILREIAEVPGRDQVFSWKGRNISAPQPNADGTVTVFDADSGHVIWHGDPYGALGSVCEAGDGVGARPPPAGLGLSQAEAEGVAAEQSRGEEADAASDTSDVDRFGEDYEGGCDIPLVEHTEIPSEDPADALQVTWATLVHVYAGLKPDCVCLDFAHRVCTPGHQLLFVALCSAAVAHMQLVPASPIWASPHETPSAASTTASSILSSTLSVAVTSPGGLSRSSDCLVDASDSRRQCDIGSVASPATAVREGGAGSKTELVPTTVEPAFMPYTRVRDLVHGTIPGSGRVGWRVIASARCACGPALVPGPRLSSWQATDTGLSWSPPLLYWSPVSTRRRQGADRTTRDTRPTPFWRVPGRTTRQGTCGISSGRTSTCSGLVWRWACRCCGRRAYSMQEDTTPTTPRSSMRRSAT